VDRMWRLMPHHPPRGISALEDMPQPTIRTSPTCGTQLITRTAGSLHPGSGHTLPMRTVLMVVGGLLVALVVTVALLISAADPATDVPLELAKALINLIVAILITGVLSYVLTQRAAHRARLDDEAQVLAGALRNLKAGYEQVQLARFYLSAHRTGAAFAEQITRLTDARSFLHIVQRERFVMDTDVDDDVQSMLNYVMALANEYRMNYRRIAESALIEERARSRFLDGADSALVELPTLSSAEFPRVDSFIDQEQWTDGEFQQSYKHAKQVLYARLDRIARTYGR
jgi:hypothetical protein